MKIAVTCENMEINGLVPKTFKDSEYLMIIDADKNQIFKIYGKQDPDKMVFAQKVLDHADVRCVGERTVRAPGGGRSDLLQRQRP